MNSYFLFFVLILRIQTLEDQLCTSWSEAECVACIGGYWDQTQSKCVPSTSVANCLYYENQTTCNQCKSGQFQLVNNQCSDMNADYDCIRYDKGKCTHLRTGAYLENNQIFSDSPGFKKYKDAFCSNVKADGKCFKCIAGYHLEGGICVNTGDPTNLAWCENVTDFKKTKKGDTAEYYYCHQCFQPELNGDKQTQTYFSHL